MATLITKNSSTASAVPAAGDLVKGELAVNVTDKKVYTKDNSAAVVKLVGSLGNQEANAVAITGGAINGTTIGATTPSTGAFTTASASSGFTGNLTGNVTGNVSGTAANVTGVVAIANGGTGLSSLGTGVQSALGQAVTGSGGIVLATSPSLTTPNLGTPSAAVLTNATGLPLTTGVTGTLGVANGGTGITAFGTGVATALGQNVTGSGGIVLATSPSLTTPNLGTPSAATLTNATGLPISTGVSGLGTGVATALAVNTGSSGAFVVNGGALGTPSSGTVTNLTGTASININGTVGATTPTTGAFTTLSASGNITVSGGTANGVAYLNGSKVLTTGSALTFDGTNLFNDQSTASPIGIRLRNGSTSTSAGTRVSFEFGGSTTGYVGNQFDGADFNNQYQANRFHIWLNGASETMRLTSASLYTASGINVGIGTSSPATRLEVRNDTSNAARVRVTSSATTAGQYRGYEFGNGSVFKGGLLQDQSTDMISIFTPIGGQSLNLTTEGNLGLGVTPSAWNANNKSIIQLQNTANLFTRSTGLFATSNVVYNSADTGVFQANGYGLMYQQNQTAGTHVWLNTPNNTSGAGATASLTSAMTLDASGNLLVGDTTNPGGRFYMKGNYARFSDGTYTGLFGKGSDLVTGGGTADLAVRSDGAILFSYGSTERARITSGGDLLVGGTSSTGANEKFLSTTSTNTAITAQNTNASNTSDVILARASRNTTDSTFRAITYYNDGAGAYRFIVQDSGNVQNTNNSYGAISDIKLKENITDATPKLEKLQQVRVVNYNLIGETQKQIGVIAQELEQIFPGMVEEAPDRDAEGNDLGTTTKSVKYSVFVPMLIKAIQEQQAIITDLRARVAQLEAK